jgi:hypothetical protein
MRDDEGHSIGLQGGQQLQTMVFHDCPGALAINVTKRQTATRSRLAEALVCSCHVAVYMLYWSKCWQAAAVGSMLPDANHDVRHNMCRSSGGRPCSDASCSCVGQKTAARREPWATTSTPPQQQPTQLQRPFRHGNKHSRGQGSIPLQRGRQRGSKPLQRGQQQTSLRLLQGGRQQGSKTAQGRQRRQRQTSLRTRRRSSAVLRRRRRGRHCTPQQ